MSSPRMYGPVAFVAATCIGSGTLALPLILAPLGLLPSMILMGLMWALMYYSALVNLELNLQAGKGLPLGPLAAHFSGKTAALIGWIALKLLSYALLTVYLSGLASVLGEVLDSPSLLSYSACGAIVLLLMPMRWIDYMNRCLFGGLLAVGGLLILVLLTQIEPAHIPWLGPALFDIDAWMTAIPIVFTAFGFQVIFHTVTEYCARNASLLQKVFIWGTLIPALVYALWVMGSVSVLSATPNAPPLQGSLGVGAFMHALCARTDWPFLKTTISLISLLLLSTSILGVGLGLRDAMKALSWRGHALPHIAAVLTTVLPAWLIALWVPNAFLTLLGVAGCILVVIALLLPVYLLYQLPQNKIWYYPVLSYTSGHCLTILAAILIMACELGHLWYTS